MNEHEFTPTILAILREHFGGSAEEVLERSPLLQYLNIKTRSASRGSKSRGSFGNHYALYVLAEDYLNGAFNETNPYADYEGARFADLFRRQRELPFGAKLQNHALNHRLNEEFGKYFPTENLRPILRDPETNRYWLNERLFQVPTSDGTKNIASAVVDIIDAYVLAKQDSFKQFIEQCRVLQELPEEHRHEAIEFLDGLLAPTVDARIFEIVSYAILKAYYRGQTVFFGFDEAEIEPHPLMLFKTGRTNANDGGIDFVMQPLGRFFQVTESVDVKKYFLDIDKVQHFPITFVVKSEDSPEEITQRIAEQARRLYTVDRIVTRYIAAVEEIINLPTLRELLAEAVADGELTEVLSEVALQARIEFNYEEDDDPEDEDPSIDRPVDGSSS